MNLNVLEISSIYGKHINLIEGHLICEHANKNILSFWNLSKPEPFGKMGYTEKFLSNQNENPFKFLKRFLLCSIFKTYSHAHRNDVHAVLFS